MTVSLSKGGKPIRTLDDWESLAGPKSRDQWVPDRSAMELARSWCTSGEIASPAELTALLDSHELTCGAVIERGEPECQIPFDQFSGPRNADLALIARNDKRQIAITIEGKADETFDVVIAEVFGAAVERRLANPASKGVDRLLGLLDAVFGPRGAGEATVDSLRYQLVTGTAGTLAYGRATDSAVRVFVVHEFKTRRTREENHARNQRDLDEFVRRLSRGAIVEVPRGQLVGPIPIPGGKLFQGGDSILIGKITTECEGYLAPVTAAATDSARVAEFVLSNLPVRSTSLHEAYFYSCLSCAVLDAVFSIGVKYEGTEAVVRRYCDRYEIQRLRASRDEVPAIENQEPLDKLIERIESTGPEVFAEQIVRNRQRTSARGGILKAEAVLQFARVLSRHDVRYFQDLPRFDENSALNRDLRAIAGQGSGISVGYFWMLAGADDQIKPDRMILGFLRDVLGREVRVDEARRILPDACEVLRTSVPHVTPRLLDFVIWQYQRNRV